MATAPEPVLPEMTGASTPRLDDAGIVTMPTRKRATQPVRIGWHKDEVHVVRHQAPGPHLDATARQFAGSRSSAVSRYVPGFMTRRAASCSAGHRGSIKPLQMNPNRL